MQIPILQTERKKAEGQTMNDNHIKALAHQVVILRDSLLNENVDDGFINLICEVYIRSVMIVANLNQ